MCTRNAYFLPSSSGSKPASTAAMPVAPAPSTTAFSISTRRRIARAMNSSLTTTILSIKGAAVANALTPTNGTARPITRNTCSYDFSREITAILRAKDDLVKKEIWIKMHSSRMRTVRSSGRWRRGVCPGGAHGECLPQCMLGYTPPSWTEWLTDACENIILPQLRCGR